MRMSTPQKIAPARTEQIILFRASNQLFAISSASVQEVRSVDSLAGAAVDVNESSLAKVRHAIHRGDLNLYVVNAPLHFGLRPTPAALIFLLRKSRIAILVDGIEKMTTMTRLQALPGALLPRRAHLVSRPHRPGSKRDSRRQSRRFSHRGRNCAIGRRHRPANFARR